MTGLIAQEDPQASKPAAPRCHVWRRYRKADRKGGSHK